MVKEVNADLTLCLCTKSEKTGREFLKNRNKQRRKKRMLTPSGLKDIAKNKSKNKNLTTEGMGETISALNKQTGGTHYKDMVIQPAEYAEQNGLSLLEGNVVKYISRWKKKGKPLEDLTKAKHCIDLLIEIHKVK